jgi:SAM-dependent methyltransferase
LNETIAYYNTNAEQFRRDTLDVDMSALYEPFLRLVPQGGKILDAGCGSGRDSLRFKQHGYEVEAFDASSEMCRLASALIDQPVHLKTFDDVNWVSEFDGIWACASLLHVRRDSIDSVLEKLCRALRPNGAVFVSFKLRDEEWEQDGRFFNGYSEDSFRGLIEHHTAFLPQSMWVSDDARPERRDEKWLNVLLQRVHN